MSLFSIAVLVLLFVRHRGNLARIWAGTERRVNFRGAASPAIEPGGPGRDTRAARSSWWCWSCWRCFARSLVGGIQIYRQATEPIEVSAGPWTLRETDRATTGQQRVDRVAFAAEGSRLAATCPRYDRVVVYRVEPDGKLAQIREIQLEGRPVALATLGDRFVVLETPTGDQRHVEPGWWETFDPDGNRLGGRHLAGYYPDDLAVTPDGKHLLVTQLGPGRRRSQQSRCRHSKSSPSISRPSPVASWAGSLLTPPTIRAGCRCRPPDDCAAVLLTRTNQTLAIDLSAPESPQVIGRTKSTGSDTPYVSYSPDSDWIMMPVASQSEGIAIRAPRSGAAGRYRYRELDPIHHVDYLVCTRHRDSVLELFQTEPTAITGTPSLEGTAQPGPDPAHRTGLRARTRPAGRRHSLRHDPHGRDGAARVGRRDSATRHDRRRASQDIGRGAEMTTAVTSAHGTFNWPTLSRQVILNRRSPPVNRRPTTSANWPDSSPPT